MTRKSLWLYGLSLGVLLLVGFLALTAFAKISLSRQILEAEQKWAEQEITSYRLQVEEIIDIRHWQTYDITVEKGRVTAHSAVCNVGPAEFRECKVWPYEPEKYTIPALFAEAHRLAQADNVLYQPELEFQFDPTYGFPARMSQNVPQVTDSFRLLEVKKFEPLPE
jgi:hypothetical protein